MAATAPLEGVDDTGSSSSYTDLERSFLRSGWCIHQVRRLQLLYSPDTLHYLSGLNRRGYRANTHDACKGETRCIANNVDLRKYQSAHTSSCTGSCTLISVDYNAVVEIIRAGGIPIVSIHSDARSLPALRLSIAPRTTSTRYTVMSHVWFDGLGNPAANGLPTCQVQRLNAHLRSLPPDRESGVFRVGSMDVDWSRQSFVRTSSDQAPQFWMDTLCIPVGDAHKALRAKAINQMASIYAAAVQELVLDAELLQCEANDGTALEALARVACSAWMTRSWTLQEGVLARECMFQFRDRAIDPIREWCIHGMRSGLSPKAPAALFPEPDDTNNWAVYKELYNCLWDTLHHDWKSSYRRDPPTPAEYKASGGAWYNLGGFQGSQAAGKVHTLPAAQGLSKRGRSGLDEKDHFTMDLRDEHRLKQFVDMWNELAHRSTTMPDDLHVIIANLLDFNADRIMELPTREDRMRAMVLSFDLLPISLFWNTGPRLSDKVASSRHDNNRWIPLEPSKTAMTIQPTMRVADGWLELNPDLEDDQTHTSRPQILLLHQNPGFYSAESHVHVGAGTASTFYKLSLLGNENRAVLTTDPSMGDGEYCLIVETLGIRIGEVTKAALFCRLSTENSTQTSVLQLQYCCPAVLENQTEGIKREIVYIHAEVLPPESKVAVKFNPIPHFVRHSRRLNRGPSLQGSVAIMVILPIPVTLGIGCMVAFIVVMARPPHKFTPTAGGLLAAFLILYFGAMTLGIAWGLFIDPFMYRMWLASFDSGWEDKENTGWWGRFVRMEQWLGRIEHRLYTTMKNGVGLLAKPFVQKSRLPAGERS